VNETGAERPNIDQQRDEGEDESGAMANDHCLRLPT
jgi:hypothetical protein